MFVFKVPSASEAFALTSLIPNFLINEAKLSVPKNRCVLTAKILSDTAIA